jgi:hypothetical protein
MGEISPKKFPTFVDKKRDKICGKGSGLDSTLENKKHC